MAREKRPENAVGVRLDLADDVRKRLIVAAAKLDLSMAACLRMIVNEWIDEHEPAAPALDAAPISKAAKPAKPGARKKT